MDSESESVDGTNDASETQRIDSENVQFLHSPRESEDGINDFEASDRQQDTNDDEFDKTAVSDSNDAFVACVDENENSQNIDENNFNIDENCEIAEPGFSRRTDDYDSDEAKAEPFSDSHLSDSRDDESREAHESENREEKDTSQVGESQLIADIFGESEGEEEFEGFEKDTKARRDDRDDDEYEREEDNEVEREESKNLYDEDEEEEQDRERDEDAEQGESSRPQEEIPPEAALPELSSDESEDESIRKRKLPEDFVYDFDLMMQKRKESFRRRKRKNSEIINDSDDMIAELIQEMKQAAEDDFQLNKDRKAATRKLKLLPVVERELRKIDLREAFLDAGVLGVITDWLTPLPDRSLPNLQVRETMIKLLSELNIVDVERLKASGIGKAIMYLFKHPKETKENKRRAGALIANWSRPIFNLDTDFHSMSKEEREQRDFEHMTKTKRRLSDVSASNEGPASVKKHADERVLRPGEKGWIPRARVPMPSTRDYVIRPKSNVETDVSRTGNKKAITRLDKHLRNFRERKKQMKVQRAVAISIEGRKMRL
ncbi:Med26 domain containing protein-like protein [Dinothrombium tinctorium]|uniref:Med26 domain containing protein-like protein n=2 Tax=Dinothrombium tinctorium TaxID=1965070 RepID=A0A3S4Q9R5_9ACAR|nr:Med26 domain containing protein-like protein [Dinothrombium tinctorium]